MPEFNWVIHFIVHNQFPTQQYFFYTMINTCMINFHAKKPDGLANLNR